MAAASPSDPPPPPTIGPGQYALIRFLAVILALGVFSNFSSQISVSNEVQTLMASSTGGLVRLDDFAVHVAEEKAGKIERLEKEIDSLRAQLEESQKQQGNSNPFRRDATDAPHHHAGNQTDDGIHNSAEICKLLPKPVQDASYLWNQHLADIHQSMRHDQDDGYVFHDLTAHILHLLTPIRLQRSRLTPPTDYKHVGRILDKAHRRYVYYKQHKSSTQRRQTAAGDEQRYERIDDRDSDAPPPVDILVMGGSVAMGVLCKDNPVTTEGLARYARRGCAWPMRLEMFVNNALRADVIRIQTVTLGGTNSESGVSIWKYGLQPDDYPHPDVLINAYSTNDVHVNSVQAAEARNQTIHEAVFEMTQKFIRTVLNSDCRPPLLLYFDDYVGNEQNEVLETTKLSQTIHLLSRYYGTMSVSYANAVRDLVFRGTDEDFFSPHGWFEGPEKKWTRQIHPGMTAHFAFAIIVAWNFLSVATTFCSLHVSQLDVDGAQPTDAGNGAGDMDWDYGYRDTNGLPRLRNGRVPRGPRPKIDALPPLLDADLTLEAITQRWLNAASKQQQKRIDDGSSDCVVKRPCVFSFVSGLERNLNKPKVLLSKLKPYLTNNRGWDAVDDNGKNGFVPTMGIGSKFTLELKQLKEPVNILTFMVMTSYSAKWESSKIRVEAFFRKKGGSDKEYEKLAKPMEISGEHNKQTSETYVHEMQLTGGESEKGTAVAAVGGDLKVDVELIGGSTFKLMGMAFCHLTQINA